ncbi:MAG: hypothetical protein U0411_02205 [Thermodesulfovibrionales bacterium]
MSGFKHIGGERVNRGSYWNFSTGERVTLTGGGVLPGDGTVTYYRANPLFVLFAGPLLGLVYAVFLPFIGIAALLKIAGEHIFGRIVRESAKAAHFGWRPSEAYLTGKKHKATEEKAMQEKGDPVEDE